MQWPCFNSTLNAALTSITLRLSSAPTLPIEQAMLCPAEEDSVWRIHWPSAAPGSTQSVRCPGEGDTTGLGLAHRSCGTGRMWGSVDASECGSVAVREVRMKVRKDISGTLGTLDNNNWRGSDCFSSLSIWSLNAD